MNRFKFNEFKRQFPFLNEILAHSDGRPRTEDEIDSIKVARLDEQVFKMIPVDSAHDGSLGSSGSDKRIAFIVSDGTVLKDAVYQEVHRRSNYAHESESDREGESILEAIDRHGVKDSLQFVVSDHYEWSDWQGSDRYYVRHVTIYKLPKDLTLAEALRDAEEEVARAVAAEAAF